MAALATDSPERLAELAEQAIRDGTEDRAEPRLAAWCKAHPGDSGVRHWLALLQRSLDCREAALDTLAAAREIAPGDAALAHAQAQVALEAGIPANDLFLAAIRLAPGNGELRLGLATARFDTGNGELGLAELDAMLVANPGWYDGHRAYAQLAALLGHPDAALAPIRRALKIFPAAETLHHLAINLLLDAERFDEAFAATEAALVALGDVPEIRLALATALDELGEGDKARALFVALGPARDPGHAVRRARHLLRSGMPGEVSKEIEPWLTREGQETIWPYAALAWRMIGDPRSDWLDRQDGLVSIRDFPIEDSELALLVPLMRKLHRAAGRFLDQSVRQGTQTAGPLLARIDPPLGALRERLRLAVSDHVARLPAPDPGHPTLRLRRDRRPRFAGSWSVRFDGAGVHASHHHPQGWLSAVFYVSVPQRLAGEEGRLVLGEGPSDLATGVPALRLVEPRPGRLVIFPSWMWHATRPFSGSERMTIAFDIARP